jgi:RimJ/RimL family protein N-acetyltransferase
MWGDSAITRYIGGKPLSEEETWARLLRYAGHWLMLGFGYWLAEEKETGQYIGEIGFADFKRDLQPGLPGLPEVGWVLTTGSRGKGYATEAVRAVAAWGDSHFKLPRTFCIIHPENQASIRVALKCGFKELQPTSYKGRPLIMFVREAPQEK